MKSEHKEIAYKLDYDVEHYERCDLDYRIDIEIEKYHGYVDYDYYETEPIKHPDPVIYVGYLPVVKHIDYPEADNSWNVMTYRMYDALLSVGDFPHHLIPVAVVDGSVPREKRYDANGRLRKEIALWDYLAIQMTEHLDILDYEKSRISYYEDEPDKISMIDEYVFKAPENGLPPIFKIPERLVSVFVSAEAREAMKQAGVTGTRYISLKGYKGDEERDWIDRPVVLPDEVYT